MYKQQGHPNPGLLDKAEEHCTAVAVHTKLSSRGRTDPVLHKVTQNIIHIILREERVKKLKQRQVATLSTQVAPPPCMQRTLSSMVAARGSQLKRLLRRFQAHRPCCSPSLSVHSSRKPKSALMSDACITVPNTALNTAHELRTSQWVSEMGG